MTCKTCKHSKDKYQKSRFMQCSHGSISKTMDAMVDKDWKCQFWEKKDA